MERKKWTLRIVGIIVICVAILAVIYIMLSGTVINGWCHATVTLQDPVSLGENVWMVEIESVDTTGDCSGLEHFGVFLEQGESTIIVTHQLQNGLTAQADTILVFFADQGKVGSVDTGDLFYLVNLEVGFLYEFHILDGWGPAGNVTILT